MRYPYPLGSSCLHRRATPATYPAAVGDDIVAIAYRTGRNNCTPVFDGKPATRATFVSVDILPEPTNPARLPLRWCASQARPSNHQRYNCVRAGRCRSGLLTSPSGRCAATEAPFRSGGHSFSFPLGSLTHGSSVEVTLRPGPWAGFLAVSTTTTAITTYTRSKERQKHAVFYDFPYVARGS